MELPKFNNSWNNSGWGRIKRYFTGKIRKIGKLVTYTELPGRQRSDAFMNLGTKEDTSAKCISFIEMTWKGQIRCLHWEEGEFILDTREIKWYNSQVVLHKTLAQRQPSAMFCCWSCCRCYVVWQLSVGANINSKATSWVQVLQFTNYSSISNWLNLFASHPWNKDGHNSSSVLSVKSSWTWIKLMYVNYMQNEAQSAQPWLVLICIVIRAARIRYFSKASRRSN